MHAQCADNGSQNGSARSFVNCVDRLKNKLNTAPHEIRLHFPQLNKDLIQGMSEFETGMNLRQEIC